MKGELEVLSGGLLTTVQDHGRHGYRKFGVPVSGVMDEHSYKLANWLVGNPQHAPVLELTLMGGTFEFHSDAVVGISGAEAEISVNDNPAASNKSIKIKKGDILDIGRVTSGCRLYLAIAGEWDIEKIMGSYSTCLSAKFGGMQGRALNKGDRLIWKSDQDKTVERTVPKKLLPHYSSSQKIRIIEGPEWNWLTEKEQTTFLASHYSISSESNRMGIRLKNSLVLQQGRPDEMASSPVVPGIIQLPSNGSPIILMNDAQSVGGYPRIAKVIDADLWRLGQVWTWNEINFSLIGRKDAHELFDYYRTLRESYLI